LLTNSAPHIRVQMPGEGGVARSQPMSTAVHITWHGAQINFGDLPPYLTYDFLPWWMRWWWQAGPWWSSWCSYLGEGVDGDRRAHGGHHDAVRHRQVHHKHVRGCPAQTGKIKLDSDTGHLDLIYPHHSSLLSLSLYCNIHNQFLRQILLKIAGYVY